MAVRKWLIRGVLLLLTLAAGGGYYVYGQYTNPEAVAQMVLAELKQHFPEADIQLGRAEWRLFGGVRLNELRVTPVERRGQEPTALIRQTVLQIDKAQAARGKFELLKVHLEHPHLNLERDREGRWNVLSLLTAKPNEAGTIPFVSLHDGVIRFHDKKLDFPILELTNVEAKLIPQPTGILTGEGSGRSDFLGTITFRFSHQPATNITELTIAIPGVEYQPRLEAILVKLIPTWEEQQIRLQGRLGVETKITWLPHQEIPTIESTIALESGEFRHPKLPIPCQNIKAQIEYAADKVTLRALRATAGQGVVTGRGRVDLTGDLRKVLDHRAWIHLDYENLALHPGVYYSLPPILRKFCTEFQTQGLVDGSCDVTWKDRKVGLSYTVKPHEGTFEADVFPYPASDVTGQLRYDESGEVPVLHVDIRGQFGQRPFTLLGRLFGPGLRPDNPIKPGIDLQVQTTDVPLDRALLKALEPYPDTYRVVQQLHALGQFDATLRIRREPGMSPGEVPPLRRWVTAKLKDIQFRFDAFPCPIEKASAQLDLYPDRTWRITNFVGEHRGGKVSGDAWLTATTAGDVLHLELDAKEAPFSPELLGALPPEVQSVWRHFRPEGRTDCKVSFDRLEKGRPVLDVTVIPTKASIQPEAFPYRLNNVRGTFRYANNQVHISPLSADHGNVTVSVDGGHVTLRPGAGFLAQMQGISFNRLAADEDLLRALPGMLRDAVVAVRPSKPVNARFDLDIDNPGPGKPADLAWSGTVELNACQIQCGCAFDNLTGIIRLDKGSFQNGQVKTEGSFLLQTANLAGKQDVGPAEGKILLTKDHLQFHDCQVALPGGSVHGLVEVKFGSAPRYHLDVSGAGKLEEMLKKPGGPRGNVRATLQINGEGTSLKNLSGDGAIFISNGSNLCQLPFIIDVLNGFSQLLPKATNFQEAKLDFTVKGEKLLARQFQLIGDAYRVEGSGTAKITGADLDLVLTPILGGGRTMPLMPGLLDALQMSLARGLVKVLVTGSIDQVKVHVEPLPVVADPVKDIMRSLRK